MAFAKAVWRAALHEAACDRRAMTLTELRCIIAVARERHFVKVGDACFD